MDLSALLQVLPGHSSYLHLDLHLITRIQQIPCVGDLRPMPSCLKQSPLPSPSCRLAGP